MKLVGDLIVGLVKLMILVGGLLLILGGGYCVLLPLESHSADALGFAAIGVVMALGGMLLWWAIIRSFTRKAPAAAPEAFQGEPGGDRPDIDRPWERR